MQLRQYQIAEENDSRKLAQFLAKDGQGLLPMVELLCRAEMAVDEIIDITGRATIGPVLTLSAQQTAGARAFRPKSTRTSIGSWLRCTRDPESWFWTRRPAPVRPAWPQCWQVAAR